MNEFPLDSIRFKDDKERNKDDEREGIWKAHATKFHSLLKERCLEKTNFDVNSHGN